MRRKRWLVGKNDGSMRRRRFYRHIDASNWIGKQPGAADGLFYLDYDGTEAESERAQARMVLR